MFSTIRIGKSLQYSISLVLLLLESCLGVLRDVFFNYVHLYGYVHLRTGAHGVQKRMLAPLELKLQLSHIRVLRLNLSPLEEHFTALFWF